MIGRLAADDTTWANPKFCGYASMMRLLARAFTITESGLITFV